MAGFKPRPPRTNGPRLAHPFRRNRTVQEQIARRSLRAKRQQLLRKRSVYLLPNAFTTAALFCGFFAVVQAMNARFEMAAIAIFVAMVLDGMDGRVARMTHTQSAFGEQFDSLSDMVSFGVAPALVMYEWVLKDLGRWGWLAAFIYCSGAALRLARFNTNIGVVDKRSAESGRGRAGGWLRLAGDRQPGAAQARLVAMGRVRADDLRGRHDGVQCAVLQWQGARRAASCAVCGDPAGGGRVRACVVRPAADAVWPIRAVWPVRLRVLGVACDVAQAESGPLGCR
ncbi:hypothetical protein DFQ28_002470 [Apophysomyces sp. BC1034]|nr:hypothetical protein DFQ28_002470 [Apophysomyces sp. BC1034]